MKEFVGFLQISWFPAESRIISFIGCVTTFWKKPKLSPSDESKLVRMFRNNSKLLEHQHDRQRLSYFLKMSRGIFIGVGVSSSNQRTLHQLSSTMLVQSKKWLNNKEGELPPNSSASPQISSQKVKTLTQLNVPMGQ